MYVTDVPVLDRISDKAGDELEEALAALEVVGG